MPTKNDTRHEVSVHATTIVCPPAMIGLIGILAKATARQIAEAATAANADCAPAEKVRL
ncbi:MAG: hypothetical protein VXW43_03380 [Pseudomonadota bacterium]|nr:hypothetical protein [Pseudomonadota bacterium]